MNLALMKGKSSTFLFIGIILLLILAGCGEESSEDGMVFLNQDGEEIDLEATANPYAAFFFTEAG